MYTFKQAVKDSKTYLEKEDNTELIRALTKRQDLPTYRELIFAVDDVYKLFYKRLLYKGILAEVYKERKSLNDVMIIPKVIACKLVPLLVLFYFCEEFQHPALESVRDMILELIKLTTTYIDAEKIPVKNYKEIQALEI